MGGDADQVEDARNRRASILLPINSLNMTKINSSLFNLSKCLGSSIDLKYNRSR